MILRPEGTYQKCTAYPATSSTSGVGRVKPDSSDAAYDGPHDGEVSLNCIIAEAKAEERYRFHQMDIEITHTLVQRGKPKAPRGWFIMKNESGDKYRVVYPDDCGGLGLFTVYYCEVVL